MTAAKRPYRLAYQWDDGTDIKGIITRADRSTLEIDLEKCLRAAANQARPFSWRIEHKGRHGIVTLESGRLNHAADARALIVIRGGREVKVDQAGMRSSVVGSYRDAARAAREVTV